MTELGLWRQLWRLRYLWGRRLVQLGILLLFVGGARWQWPVLSGDLSASRLFRTIPLADPFAVLQILATGHIVQSTAWIGAGLVLAFYAVVGGRVFCSWVCPFNMVTDLAEALRRRLGIKSAYHLRRGLRYVVLLLALLLSVLSGVAAFEWISPLGLLQRELIFGWGTGWTAVVAVFLFDLLLVRHGWCGHLCPLGAFYALLGRWRCWKIKFYAQRCNQCGDCHKICPEPQVLGLTELSRNQVVTAGACTNCGRCASVCSQKALSYAVALPFR